MSRGLCVALITVVMLAYPGLGALTANGTVRAQSPDQVRAIITSPVDGQQLFGLVNILGSAEHPSAFARYTLEYDDLSDPTVTWLLVQPAVQQQVRDGVLGTWNTNVVPDGIYRLRLRVFLDDGQVGEYIVSNLKVTNRAPTPVPTIPAVEGIPVAPFVTPGPSPTSPVVQPPSNNPVEANAVESEPLSSGSGANTAHSVSIRQNSTRINLTRVREAFCTGFYLTIGVFVLMVGYSLVRRRPGRRHSRSLPERWPGDWGAP